jgi:hypothetical protein
MYDPLLWSILNLDLAHMLYKFLWMTWESHYLANLTFWENGNEFTRDYLFTCLKPCEFVILLARM